jgi:arylformamidase
MMKRRDFLFSLAVASILPARGSAGPTVLRNLAYGPDPKQAVDVYLPPTPRNAPILIAVHGGAWRIGDKTNRRFWQEKVRHWGDKGWVVVSVNYRMLPEADPLEQAGDVARAIAFVQGNAARWGGDAGAITLMGHSAGAHLAALLGADPALAAGFGARPWRGTIALDTVMFDVEAVMRDDPARLYRDAFGPDPDFWRAASPLARLDPRATPFLLVCSSLRRTSCPAAQAFAGAVQAHGGRAEVLAVALRHGPINADLGKPGAYTRAVDAFLATLGLP